MFSNGVVSAAFFSGLFESASARAQGVEMLEENSQTISLLRAASNLDPNPSRGGGDVRIIDGEALASDMSPLGELGASERSQGSDQISLYTVQEGDTLSQVAGMFGVSVSTIVWANDLPSGRSIRPGMTLLILPISGVRYTVQKGDTLKSVAERYKGDVDEIIAYNDLEREGALKVGQVITVPGGEVAAPKAVAKKSGGTTASKGAGGGGFTHPLPGSVRTQGIHGYNGVDLGAPAGTPIKAAAAGKVIVSKTGGWNGGYGNYVVVSHVNGTQTLYAHNSSNAVSVGAQVAQGEVIGYVGSTGRSTGNHLHFEVRGAKNPF